MRYSFVAALALLPLSCRNPSTNTIVAAIRTQETRSNILRSDYVGSAACASCHEKEFAKWSASPMRKMTRDPEHAEVRAPFAGESFVFKGDKATFFRQGPDRFIRIESPQQGAQLYHVTRVIGNHYREDFAGVEVSTPATSIERGTGPELVLPVTYYFHTHGYRPKGYSVLAHERPGLRAGAVWNQTCIFCHNTVPWFDTMWSALAGPSAPSYQGVLVDHTLPPKKRFSYRVTSDSAFQGAVAHEAALVGASIAPVFWDNAAVAQAGIRALAHGFLGKHLVEEGIGCESCHGGSREHTADPRVHTSYEPRADFLEVRPQSGEVASRALLINRTCARCHEVLFSRYPYTWEGGLRHHGEAGGSATTSGEARDLLLSGPGRNLACTACHDPHTVDKAEDLAHLATPAGNGVCTSCHPAYATRAGLAEHAHHDPTGAAGSCIACHMPRKNMALEYKLTRYHRIGSPTDRNRVERDRPLECALCHADRSVSRLLGEMEQMWGKHYDRSKLRALYGELETNTLFATLERGHVHEQVTAAMVLAEHHQTLATPLVARLLTSEFPLARRFAAQALDSLLGKPCALDVDSPREELELALARCGVTVPLPLPASAGTQPGRESGDED